MRPNAKIQNTTASRSTGIYAFLLVFRTACVPKFMQALLWPDAVMRLGRVGRAVCTHRGPTDFSLGAAVRYTSIFCVLVMCPASAPAQSGSILHRVLAFVDQIAANGPNGVMINWAANSGSAFQKRDRRLSIGDTVIIGYAAGGHPVRATADTGGLHVTPAVAATMQTGLNAGSYPLGSALYALPPAAQFSLFEYDSQMKTLDRLATQATIGIDASITNILTSRRPDLLPGIANTTSAHDYTSLISDIQSSAIGAVNTSQIIQHARLGEPAFGELKLEDLTGAKISYGMNAALQEASTAALHARQLSVKANVSGETTMHLAMNAASNAQNVSARVVNLVNDRSIEIKSLITTAIGAVNGGSVSAQ